ncbi:MAG: (d)CMP kinase [Ignavibacteriales bacterium]|nr:(d)CMP kinase [Ignavibacteriales bacterium]
MKKLVIAIDGPAASGKSTTARLVARKLGYLHIDTGAMYRAITLRVLEEKISLDDDARIGALAEKTDVRLERLEEENKVYLSDRDVSRAIRNPEVTRSVSTVSSYPAVRSVMVREQRKLAARGGVVLEGRDIGTVVLPEADLKIYLVANVAERARRRKKELDLAGEKIEEQKLVQELIDRDTRDSSREISPLRKADDAVEIDTSHLTIEQQVEFIVRRAKEIIKKLNASHYR